MHIVRIGSSNRSSTSRNSFTVKALGCLKRLDEPSTSRLIDLWKCKSVMRDVCRHRFQKTAFTKRGKVVSKLSATLKLSSRREGPNLNLRFWPSLARKLTKDRSEEHTSELQSLRHLVCR